MLPFDLTTKFPSIFPKSSAQALVLQVREVRRKSVLFRYLVASLRAIALGSTPLPASSGSPRVTETTRFQEPRVSEARRQISRRFFRMPLTSLLIVSTLPASYAGAGIFPMVAEIRVARLSK